MVNAYLVGQKKLYKDTLKEAFKSFSINPDSWEEIAQKRSNWRVVMHNGEKYHGNIRTMAAETKWQARKENTDKCLSPASIPMPLLHNNFSTYR